jgi:hypothetical protein
MSREELLSIKGGGFSASMVNAIVRFASIILEIGRTLGTVITRTRKKNAC